MKIKMQFLDGIRPAYHANSSAVVVDCKMEHSEMFDALLQFLEHITDKEWAEWERKIDANSVDIVPCRHEFYQGICAHCELPASQYRAALAIP